MDAVATEARASKATIYRRWPSKGALVADAISGLHQPPAALADTGNPRADLLAGLHRMADDVRGFDVKLLTGLMNAMRTDDELATRIRAQVVDAKREAAQCWTRRCVARGYLPADAELDLFHQLAPALVFFRLLVTGEPVDEPFLTRVVDEVLLPLLEHHRAAAGERAPETPDTPDTAWKDRS